MGGPGGSGPGEGPSREGRSWGRAVWEAPNQHPHVKLHSRNRETSTNTTHNTTHNTPHTTNQTRFWPKSAIPLKRQRWPKSAMTGPPPSGRRGLNTFGGGGRQGSPSVRRGFPSVLGGGECLRPSGEGGGLRPGGGLGFSGWGLEGWSKISRFSLSRHNFLTFFPHTLGSFRGILVAFEAPGPTNVTCGVLGLSIPGVAGEGAVLGEGGL